MDSVYAIQHGSKFFLGTCRPKVSDNFGPQEKAFYFERRELMEAYKARFCGIPGHVVEIPKPKTEGFWF